jgi:ferrous iron transport protein A
MTLMSISNQQRGELISLARLPVGTHARIEKMDGGRQMIRRLLSLGLRIGSEVEVIQHRGRGVVVASYGIRVALGGGVAEKLLMLPFEPASEE